MKRFSTFSELAALTAGRKIYIKLAGAAGYFVCVSKTELRDTARAMKKHQQLPFTGTISFAPGGGSTQVTLD